VTERCACVEVVLSLCSPRGVSNRALSLTPHSLSLPLSPSACGDEEAPVDEAEGSRPSEPTVWFYYLTKREEKREGALRHTHKK